MKARASVLAALAVLSMGAESTCGQGEPAPHQEQGRHRQQPAPAPDPVQPPKDKTFPGNVSITLWWSQDQRRTVVVFDYGLGKMHRTGERPGGHWDATVKPGQHVYGAVVPFAPGQPGRIHVVIVQNNNGRIVCEDSNDDTEGNGGSDCGDVVII